MQSLIRPAIVSFAFTFVLLDAKAFASMSQSSLSERYASASGLDQL